VPDVTSIAPLPAVSDPDGPAQDAVLPLATLETIACGLAAGLPASARDVADLSGRRWQRLVATSEYDAWLIQWGPDTHVEPHDHGGSAGALAVAAGELQDVVLTADGPQRSTVPTGGSRTIPADVVHDVVCPRGGAVSVHVYSPPLEWMTMYSNDLRPERLAQVDPEPPAWPADRVDPTSR
jgi:hypothetical protein